jgi:hypothetical protein
MAKKPDKPAKPIADAKTKQPSDAKASAMRGDQKIP